MWFYVHDKKAEGPVSEKILMSLLRAGILEPEVLIWREGLRAWVSASSVFVPLSGGGGFAKRGPPPIPGSEPASTPDAMVSVPPEIDANGIWTEGPIVTMDAAEPPPIENELPPPDPVREQRFFMKIGVLSILLMLCVLPILLHKTSCLSARSPDPGYFLLIEKHQNLYVIADKTNALIVDKGGELPSYRFFSQPEDEWILGPNGERTVAAGVMYFGTSRAKKNLVFETNADNSMLRRLVQNYNDKFGTSLDPAKASSGRVPAPTPSEWIYLQD